MASSSYPSKTLDRTGGVNSSNTGNTGSNPAAPSVAASDTKNSLSTVQTRAGEVAQLFQGTSTWTQVTLTLETAGPVVIGTGAGVKLTNGNGIKLTVGVPVSLPVARGERLYSIAGAVSRIQVIATPIPWAEQIANLLAR